MPICGMLCTVVFEAITTMTKKLLSSAMWPCVLVYNSLFFTMANYPPVGQGLLNIEASRSHSDTPHSVGLLWTSDQPDAENSTRQHTTFTKGRQSCPPPGPDSNSQSQEASDGRPTPCTARPQGPTVIKLHSHIPEGNNYDNISKLPYFSIDNARVIYTKKSSFNHADHSFTIWRVNVL